MEIWEQELNRLMYLELLSYMFWNFVHFAWLALSFDSGGFPETQRQAAAIFKKLITPSHIDFIPINSSLTNFFSNNHPRKRMESNLASYNRDHLCKFRLNTMCIYVSVNVMTNFVHCTHKSRNICISRHEYVQNSSHTHILYICRVFKHICCWTCRKINSLYITFPRHASPPPKSRRTNLGHAYFLFVFQMKQKILYSLYV
jgi:hypothetical protein